jgi:hypothetical protein
MQRALKGETLAVVDEELGAKIFRLHLFWCLLFNALARNPVATIRVWIVA